VARRLILTRALRGFVDGMLSLLLARHLLALGFEPTQVGAIVTATLLGSAALTIGVGVWARSVPRRTILMLASALMVMTGLSFAGLTAFWPLIVVAAVGTLNPSSGDVSVFLPTEQAVLSQAVPATRRTTAFAHYNLAGNLAGALGALASGAIGWADQGPFTVSPQTAFLLYAASGLVCALVYRGLPAAIEAPPAGGQPLLARSRPVVIRLSLLFSLDSFGGGFVLQSLLALWLFERFELSPMTVGVVFFGASTLAAFSQLASAPLAKRIGLIRTMVYTHVPANLFLVAAAFMPSAELAILLLLLRMSLASMDVPARQAYVMGVVPPEERTAAATATNVPRSLVAALSPLIAGWLLSETAFGWPLVIGGLIKITYDLLLLYQFRAHPADEGWARG
jgi:MFS family permease